MNELKHTQTHPDTGASVILREDARYRAWFLTINNPDSDTVNTWRMGVNGDKSVSQLEEGEEKKTPHIQAYVYYKNPKKFSQMKKLFPRARIETVRNIAASIQYCSKEESRLKGPWFHNIKQPIKLKCITKLRKWQDKLAKKLEKEPNDRTINWLWEPNGGSGKTAMARWLAIRQGAIVVGGKASDAKYAISEQVAKGSYPRIVVFTFSRTYERFVSYQAMEEIKDGIFFNNKYESKQCIFNPPHVVVFANFPPDEEKLSRDRWNIEEL